MTIDINGILPKARTRPKNTYNAAEAEQHPTPLKAFILGATVIGVLFLASIATNTVHRLVDSSLSNKINYLLSVDAESNIPTFFAFCLITLASFLCGLVAWRRYRVKADWWKHWAALSAIFMYVSYDEAAVMHERLIRPVREVTSASGSFYLAWVIPGLIVSAILALTYLSFVLDLPQRVRGLVIASAAVFLGGALGMEMIGSGFYQESGHESVALMVTAHIEEAMEMTGMLLFCTALLTLLANETEQIRAYNAGD